MAAGTVRALHRDAAWLREARQDDSEGAPASPREFRCAL